ncbi:phospholipase C [Caulobacter ginsengisoli]|uniref:Phospholipase C n=1 Tax=Caulobacter ginsengisoli TaxID=400775 RepID=A0ABU0IX25_9CAUL|nr:alkaline phosphatase family protein [Caulobacter ginsengisoli]MDQ0466549.1 phospholipase C [Caulobacter ginsengisoli]
MSSPRTAQVYVTNQTDGTATISLHHNNADYGTESGKWTVGPGYSAGPMTVHFNVGLGSLTVRDFWACEMTVTGGTTPGVYESSGTFEYSDWKECQLQRKDAGKTHNFLVDSKSLYISLDSGDTSTPMNPVEVVTSSVMVRNTTDGNAIVTLYHSNSTDGVQSATWVAGPGVEVGPMLANFRVGPALVADYWAIKLVVQDGGSPGVYANAGFKGGVYWQECQLQAADVNQFLHFEVSQSQFEIDIPSGGRTIAMEKVGPYTAVDNVFVLMLENHSFDNLFAFCNMPGLDVAERDVGNSYDDLTFYPQMPAVDPMPTDPGHEFADVVEQLCGEGVAHTPWQPYPPVHNTGFVANYATSRTEIEKGNPNLPTEEQWGQIMGCFEPYNQIPVTMNLAAAFVLCDHWFSSLPGPTWPNRFFVHGASSGGWADSPGPTNLSTWESPGFGFTYPSGASIFDRLNSAGLLWRIFVDTNGPNLGGVAQASALKGVTYGDTRSFGMFATDLQGPYPFTYTFIEPNYGDVTSGSYKGGSSQHPMDSMSPGESLIKATYEAIRNSPLWPRSLLIVTYDEHGGFYDSVKPGPAPPPDDGSPRDSSINSGGFLFDNYGVRVPAIVVSPWVQYGIDKAVYDHASIPATLEALYGLKPMTKRDAAANTVLRMLSLPTMRTDCPTVLPAPTGATWSAPDPPSPEEEAARAALPLPQTGNTPGFMAIVAKTDIELAGGDPAKAAEIKARLAAIKTVGEADAYVDEVLDRARQARGPIPPPPRKKVFS